MKKIIAFITALTLFLVLASCSTAETSVQIAATTLPVFEITSRLCQGSGIHVARLITENVSCLHDYTLQVDQMRMIEAAELIVVSGAGLESFLHDIFQNEQNYIVASQGIPLLCHEHNEEHDEHYHDRDPHIWLSPINAKLMAKNIYSGLVSRYPAYESLFEHNLALLNQDFDTLIQYAETQLSSLRCRELITFHDGFAYMADAFDLTILHAIEEESGSETSAAELIELIETVQQNKLPAIFSENNASIAAASIIAAETNVQIYQLDMAMASSSYFDAMYYNIDTLKEALG